MDNRILVVYTSKTGITRATAQKIENRFKSKCDTVDISRRDISIKEYSAIVIGTPLYSMEPPKSLLRFLKRNEKEILQKQLYMFVHGTIANKFYKFVVRAAIGEKIYKRLEEIKFLGGKVDLNKVGLAMKIFISLFIFITFSNKSVLNSINNEQIDEYINGLEKKIK